MSHKPTTTTGDAEDATGIGIDRGGVREIRAHCIMDWYDVLTVRRCGKGWEFLMDNDNGLHLSDERLRALGHAFLEATDVE